MNETDESSLLARCPRCTYSLRGLPAQHRCPECGLEVDRRWRIFGGRTMPGFGVGSRGFKIWMIVIAAYVLTQSCAYSVTPANRAFALVPVGMGMIAAICVLLATRRPRALVAVGPRGVMIYRGKDRATHHPWDPIRRARYDLKSRAMILEVGDDWIYLKTSRFVGLRIGEADRCILAINQYPRPKPPVAAEGDAAR